jgi:hypothetical protein
MKVSKTAKRRRIRPSTKSAIFHFPEKRFLRKRSARKARSGSMLAESVMRIKEVFIEVIVAKIV